MENRLPKGWIPVCLLNIVCILTRCYDGLDEWSAMMLAVYLLCLGTIFYVLLCIINMKIYFVNFGFMEPIKTICWK